MCTFNGARFLKEQLESILAQTYPFDELLISDDLSTDDTVTIINDFQRRDPRIRLVINDQTIGANRNFEKSLRMAKGDYLAPSDQDDLWDPGKIEIMLSQWKQGALMMYSLPGSMDERGSSSRKSAPAVRYEDISDLYTLVFNTPINGHATMFRKELLNDCPTFPGNIYWDWWLSMHAVSRGIIGCVPQTLAWQRIHGSNLSRGIHGISSATERQAATREQWINFIRTFFATEKVESTQKDSLLQYASLLERMDGRKFSTPMFWYIWRHRQQVFHYKQKPLLFFSYLKHSFRMGRTGVL
jgi:glycosyltransferase involved in cell wall biosynthesis